MAKKRSERLLWARCPRESGKGLFLQALGMSEEFIVRQGRKVTLPLLKPEGLKSSEPGASPPWAEGTVRAALVPSQRSQGGLAQGMSLIKLRRLMGETL